MSGYSPAPTKPTRILGPDGVPLTGDVTIAPGNFQSIIRAGNGLVVANAAAQKSRSLELFVPGNLTARTLVIATNVPSAVLQGIDAYFKTPPGVGTDVNNFANLRISGSLATVNFPFNINGQAEWHLSLADLSQVVASNGTLQHASVAIGSCGMESFQFNVAAPVVVGGVAWTAPDASYFLGTTDQTLRVGIAAGFGRTDGKTRGTTPWKTFADGKTPSYIDTTLAACIPNVAAADTGKAFTTAVFPQSIALAAATPYAVVWIGTQGLALGRIPLGQGYTAGASNMGGQGYIEGHSHGTTGNNDYNDAQAWDADAITTGNDLDLRIPPVKLLGSVLGTAIGMPVTIALTITGAPANPGADLALSLQF